MNLWLLARLLVYALVLLLIVRGLRLALQVAPMNAARRRALLQGFPLVELLVSAVFVLTAVRELFEGWPQGVALLGIVFGGLWLARHALMDIITGVLLRTGGNVALGDRVRLEGLEGRVTRLGTRVLAVETHGGDEALVPYSLLSRQAVIRTPLVHGSHRYTFRLLGEDAVEPDEVRRLVLLCHWSAVARPPVIELGPDGTCEVTVFAIAPDRGPDIEAYVRSFLTMPAGEGPRRSGGNQPKEPRELSQQVR